MGETLLKIGFGQVEPVKPPLSLDPSFIIYFKRLQAAENFALRKKLGFKYYIKPTKKAVENLFKQLQELSKTLPGTAMKRFKSVSQLSPT